MKYTKKNQSGFTLVEIAIVLVIIGLLLGAVLKGQEMITSAKVTNTVTTLKGLQIATLGFQDRFRVMPGDSSTANTLVGGGAVPCVTTCNDGAINSWENVSLVTNHLAASGFYSGAFGNAEDAAIPTLTNAPLTPFSSPAFVATAADYYTLTGTGTGSNTNGVWTGGGTGIPAKILAEIDRKIDDGVPTTGTFRMSDMVLFSGGPFPATGCIAGSGATATWDVSEALTSNNCGAVMMF